MPYTYYVSRSAEDQVFTSNPYIPFLTWIQRPFTYFLHTIHEDLSGNEIIFKIQSQLSFCPFGNAVFPYHKIRYPNMTATSVLLCKKKTLKLIHTIRVVKEMLHPARCPPYCQHIGPSPMMIHYLHVAKMQLEVWNPTA